MDPRETVHDRCSEIGFDNTVATDPDATIRGSRALPPAAQPRFRSDARPGDTSRELPRISVDLAGTLSAPGARRAAPASDERDLEVLAVLGEGGMGRVFLARQHSLDRDVAIKTVRDRASEHERAALFSEGAITGHLEHPSIIPVHALGVDAEERPVLVMKRVEGVEWTQLLADPRHPAWEGRGGGDGDRLGGHLEILMQVCNAVHFAHSRHVVHRDIKPQNVMIGRYGEVYLGDWGIAVRTDRAWRPQPLSGTPSFMAPEMVSGEPVDARTDVYLLGATLHLILTGQPRHAGPTLQDVLVSAARSAPIAYPPSVPAELGALANRATAPDPKERPGSAEELRRAIADHLGHKSSVALGESAIERLEQLRRLADDGAALGREDAQREIERLGAEARFALDQALKAWSENPGARRAVAELEALLASRRTRAAELERLARDLDPRVSDVQRAVGLAAVALVGVGLSLAAILGDRRDVSPEGLFYQSLGPLGAFALAAAVLRRHLFRTTLNRNATVGLLTGILGITVSRALGLLGGVSAPHMLVHDALLLTAVSAVFAALLFRWLAYAALILLASAAWGAAFPEQAMLAFSCGTGASLLVCASFAWNSARRDAPRAGPPAGRDAG